MKRGGPLKRKTELARVEMQRKPVKQGNGMKRAAKQPKPPPAKWRKLNTGRCAACGKRGQTEIHHVVYAQAVKREGGDLWDPRNGICLDRECHAAHHARTRVLSMALLSPDARAFAHDLLGDFADDYLRRRYAS